MKQIKYYCDLCREQKGITELYCLNFDSTEIPQRYKLIKDIKSADKHICLDCLKEIKNLEIKQLN